MKRAANIGQGVCEVPLLQLTTGVEIVERAEARLERVELQLPSASLAACLEGLHHGALQKLGNFLSLLGPADSCDPDGGPLVNRQGVVGIEALGFGEEPGHGCPPVAAEKLDLVANHVGDTSQQRHVADALGESCDLGGQRRGFVDSTEVEHRPRGPVAGRDRLGRQHRSSRIVPGPSKDVRSRSVVAVRPNCEAVHHERFDPVRLEAVGHRDRLLGQ